MRLSILALAWLSSPAFAAPLFIPAQQSTAVDTATVKSLVVTCPAGRVAISGGVELTGATAGIAITTSGPEGVAAAPNQWFGTAIAVGRTAGAWGMTVNALCASPAVMAQVQVVTALRDVTPGSTFVDAYAYCPAGTNVVSGGARIYGAIDGAALTASGPESNTQWYGVATLPAGAQAGMRVDVFCVPEALWLARFTQVTQIVSPVAGYGWDAAACPLRTYALGGGVRVAGPINGVAVQATNPDPLGLPPTSWTTAAAEVGTATPGWVLRTDTFCLRL